MNVRTRRPSRAGCVRTAVGLSLALIAGSAEALPIYPGVIDSALTTPENSVNCGTNSSRCLACHATAAGGRNTATRPFALTLAEFGFGRDSNPSELRDLLTVSSEGASISPNMGGGVPMFGAPTAETTNGPGGLAMSEGLANRDSDGDGALDLDELRECGNPSGEDFRSIPEYGCDGGSISGARVPFRGVGWFGLVLCGLALRRRAGRFGAQSNES